MRRGCAPWPRASRSATSWPPATSPPMTRCAILTSLAAFGSRPAEPGSSRRLTPLDATTASGAVPLHRPLRRRSASGAPGTRGTPSPADGHQLGGARERIRRDLEVVEGCVHRRTGFRRAALRAGRTAGASGARARQAAAGPGDGSLDAVLVRRAAPTGIALRKRRSKSARENSTCGGMARRRPRGRVDLRPTRRSCPPVAARPRPGRRMPRGCRGARRLRTRSTVSKEPAGRASLVVPVEGTRRSVARARARSRARRR